MWAVEHNVETSARGQADWRHWADVQRRPEWNAGVERIELRGPLAVIIVRTTHRIEHVGDERSRITYRMEITAPAAETVGPEIGPEISGDFPQVLAALAARAEARA